MELIFLREQDLYVLDHAYATDDYEIVFDALVPQKSKFVINKTKLKAEIGDLLVTRQNNYFYVGVITSLKETDKNTINLEAMDYLSIFDVEVPLPTSFNGNIANFIIARINETFKTSGDAYQNISYLQFESEVNVQASLSYEADTKANLLDLVEEFSKTYGIRLSYELVITNGSFSNIKVKVVATKRGVNLRYNLSTITNLEIKDTNENSLNKIVFVPKSDNSSYRSRVTYYLYTDGTISTVNNLDRRNKKVKFKYDYYTDNDYPSLLTKATKELIDSSLKHSITFDFAFIANKVEFLDDLSVGTFVQFISKEKVYDTLISKVVYKGTLNKASITLGEYRVTLTDKLKLLDRRK